MRRLGIASMVVLGWLVLALAVDRLLVSPACHACVDVAALGVKLELPAAQIDYPPVSLLVLFFLPIALFAAAMVPWRDVRSRQAWTHAIESWWEPTFWLLVALALAIAFESAYILVRQYLPQAASALAERFTLVGTVSTHWGSESATPLALRASLAGLVGLAIGAYLFLQHGLNGVLRWFKA